MDFSKEKLQDAIVVKNVRYNYVLVIVDCFSKYCWCFVIKHKTPEEIISCYKQIFKDRGKPRYLWWDQERAIDSHKFKEFLDSKKVKMYHTFSEIKVSVAERMIRTLKEKCERIKTQCELEGIKYSLVEVLPKVLEEYNLRTVHSAIGMTPNEASKKENEGKLQEMYREKYLKYVPPEGHHFKIGDHVRISVYKSLFTKGYKHNWSKEIFIVSMIHDTRPVTYSIKDLNNEEVTGKFYSQELLKSV